MPGLRRLPSLLLIGAVLGGGSSLAAAQSLQDAIDAWKSGDAAGAAEALKAVLAENLDNEEAFVMWREAEQQVVLEMLLERGELGLLTERFLGVAKLGRGEVTADPAAAQEAVDALLAADLRDRQRALLELRATYGSWAVPALLGPLSDGSSIDHRVHAMEALVSLGDRAVLPLAAALGSDNPTTRRNAAAVLGTLGDLRAAPALAWLAGTEEDPVARDVAVKALGKMGLAGADPTEISALLVGQYLRGDPAVLPAYDASSVTWEWKDGELVGTPILGGLHRLAVAEAMALAALEHGADDAIRPLLAAVHAAQKAEIEEASRLPELEGNELLAAAQERLPKIDVNVALAGGHRGAALGLLLAGGRPQTLAALTLMRSMDNSLQEIGALQEALQSDDSAVATGAALALARLGRIDGADGARVVAQLAYALSAVPERLVVSIGDTGLTQGREGWQLIAADGAGEGLLRAKSFPPKSAIVVQDGLPGVTLDTLVFGLKNDARTAGTPIIVVTADVDGVSALYGDQVAKVVSRASLADVGEVAPEATADQQRALDRAREAAEALLQMPAVLVAATGDEIKAALQHAGDDALRATLLALAGRAGAVEALPEVEALVADESASPELRVAAMNAAASLWSLGANGSGPGLEQPLLAAISGDDPALATAAAAALGQLRSADGSTLRGAVR